MYPTRAPFQSGASLSHNVDVLESQLQQPLDDDFIYARRRSFASVGRMQAQDVGIYHPPGRMQQVHMLCLQQEQNHSHYYCWLKLDHSLRMGQDRQFQRRPGIWNKQGRFFPLLRISQLYGTMYINSCSLRNV